MIADVYIDLYFLINTCMNLLCIMITASLLHRKISRLRACLGAIVGAIYAVFALLFFIEGGFGTALDCAAAFVMCLIAFAHIPFRILDVLKCTAVQALTSMLLGGIMTALYSLLNRLHLPFEVLQGDGLSVWSFAILSAVAGIATAHGGRFFGISKRTKSVTVNAVIEKKTITMHALVDSGNLLRDPISGRYVIVVNKELLLKNLPRALWDTIEHPLTHKSTIGQSLEPRVRLIPTQTATGHALLPAFLPERLTITEGKNTYSADYLIAAAELGDNARGFDAVIPFE